MEQLELSLQNPYTLRLPIDAALDLFWAKDWQYTAKARTTRKCFSRLKGFHIVQGVRYCDEGSRYVVEAMRRWLKAEGLAEATINTHHMILTRLYNFLYELKETANDYATIVLPTRNPGSLVPKVDESPFADGEAYSKDAVLKFIAAALELNDLGMAEMIEIRYVTGLRPGDGWALTSKNVSLAYKAVSGIQHKSISRRNPSGRPYLNPVPDEAMAILRRRMGSVKEGDPLFNKSNRQKRWAAVRRLAGMPTAKFKNIRQSTATLLLDNNVDLESIRNIMGWSTLRMLPTYAKRNLSHLRTAAEKLGDKKTEIVL